MRRFLIPIAALLVFAAAFGWWWYQPEKVVSRRVAGLFEAASFPEDAGNLTRSTRGAAIEPFLAETITFGGPEGETDEVAGPQKREEIVSMYAGLAKFSKSITMRNLEIDSVTVNGDEATVVARVDAVIELQSGGSPVDGIQNLEMIWTKTEGGWQLSSAKWTESPH